MNTTPTNRIENLVQELIDQTEVPVPSTLTDPFLRELYRNEVLVLQRVAKRMQEQGHPMTPDWLSGIYIGMETILRRIQDVQQAGVRKVYYENYPDQSDQSKPEHTETTGNTKE